MKKTLIVSLLTLSLPYAAVASPQAHREEVIKAKSIHVKYTPSVPYAETDEGTLAMLGDHTNNVVREALRACGTQRTGPLAKPVTVVMWTGGPAFWHTITGCDTEKGTW